MAYYIGIDLGTSAVKMIMMTACGDIVRSVSKEYPIYFPQTGWSEQDPRDWWRAVKEGMKELVAGDGGEVRGISFGGQMHGLVTLDEHDEVIRRAILWNDGRSAPQCEYLNGVIGKKTLSSYTANIAFAGFTAPKILWMRENEPELFSRIDKIMLPKDYIAYMLTGSFCTDMSDASGMLLLDVEHRRWSREMLDIVGITESMLPQLYESSDVVGTVLPSVADEIGINRDVCVIAGAGDNAAAAIGTGTVRDGMCNISLGTSGTVFIARDKFSVDENNALHSFAHSNGKYHLMGCMLSAASCERWLVKNILGGGSYDDEENAIKTLGENRVFFLPYLMGERSPHNDPDVRAMYIGMSMDTTRADIVAATLEGVSFALRDSIEIAREGGGIVRSTICGGGAKSPLWCEITANILNMEIVTLEKEEGPAFGAAILAAVGCGEYRDVEEAADKLIAHKHVYRPTPELVEKYDERYMHFKRLYPAIKELYKS